MLLYTFQSNCAEGLYFSAFHNIIIVRVTLPCIKRVTELMLHVIMEVDFYLSLGRVRMV